MGHDARPVFGVMRGPALGLGLDAAAASLRDARRCPLDLDGQRPDHRATTRDWRRVKGLTPWRQRTDMAARDGSGRGTTQSRGPSTWHPGEP